MLNKKFKKILTISMVFSMLFCNNAFATPIDLVNSTENVQTDTLDKTQGTDYFDDEDANEWLNGEINEEVRVTVDIESLFEITIPKDVVLDGETGKADYQVTVKGDIAGDQKITVTPDETFNMEEKGGKNAIIATVTQDDKEFVYNEINESGKTVDGLIEANDLTAGEWSGKFVFNINFGEASFLTKGDMLEAYSWDEIAAISEAGLAEEYFNIGDEKTITLNSTATTDINTLTDEGETYTVRIIGFNHDDLIDGSGKAGITFMFTQIIDKYYMNSSSTNSGGWKKSAMREYINNTIFNSFPYELKTKIKFVNKITDNNIITQDKLFLLSYTEYSENNNTYVYKNQGKMYEYIENNGGINNFFIYDTDGNLANWWTRSILISGASGFMYRRYTGNWIDVNSTIEFGVAPAFCI